MKLEIYFKAIMDENIECIKKYLDNGGDVNAKDDTAGSTLLHAACRRLAVADDLEIIKLLLQKGADMNEKDNAGNTPFDFIFEINNTNKTEKIIDIARGCASTALFIRASERCRKKQYPQK